MSDPVYDALLEALKKALPADQAEQMARLFAQAPNDPAALLGTEMKFAALKAQIQGGLAGKSAAGEKASVNFGSGNNIRDVKIDDIAGGNIIKNFIFNFGTVAPPPDKPRIYISHFASEASAAPVLASLREGLEQVGFEVLPDGDRLSGVEWNNSQFMWMGLAHAALLFVTPAALASPWVQTEARILTGRFMLKDILDRPFYLIPVLFDAVQPADLAQLHPALPGLGLPAVRGASANDIIPPLFAGLAELAEKVQDGVLGEALLEEVARQIGDVLSAADIKVLRELAGLLRLKVPQNASNITAARLVAGALWHTDLKDWFPVVKKLTSVRQVDLRGLVDKAEPAWVNPCAARCLVDAARPGAPRRVLAVNGQDVSFITRTFIRRAFYKVEEEGFPFCEVNNLADVNRDPIETIWSHIKEDILKEPELTTEKARQELQDQLLLGQVFIAFPPPGPDVALMPRIHKEFPDLVFLILTGPDTLGQPEDDIIQLEPALRVDEEEYANDKLGAFRRLGR